MDRITLKVSDGTEMSCVIAKPSKPGRFPGMIVLQEAFGVNAHIQSIAQRFADAGFVAIAPELFHRTAPVGFTGPYNDFSAITPHFQAVTEEHIYQDTRACFEWLQSQGCQAISTIGYCMGGRASFIANGHLPLRSAICYYGGRTSEYLHLAPKQNGSLLFFWAGHDTHIPPEQIQKINSSLREAKKNFTSVEISDAHHGFFCEDRPVYNAKAARESWALTLEFLSDST